MSDQDYTRRDDYHAAARNRLHDARALLDEERYNGATYFALLAAECALKTMICDAHNPDPKDPTDLQKIHPDLCTGSKGHNLQVLRERLDDTINGTVPDKVRKRVLGLEKWTAQDFSAARYGPESISEEQA